MNPKVAIGLLSHHGEYHPEMQRSLDALVRYSFKHNIDLIITRHNGSVIPKLRNEAVKKAMEYNCSHLLFIDSDMVFDKDYLEKLLNLDRDIVGGLCVVRQEPFAPVVKKIDDDGIYRVYHGLEDGRFRSDADAIGTAFMLIKIGVFNKIKPPWFAMPPFGEGVIGEDMYFCKLAKEAGYDICIDPQMIVGHVGDYVYTFGDYIEYRDERERREKEKNK